MSHTLCGVAVGQYFFFIFSVQRPALHSLTIRNTESRSETENIKRMRGTRSTGWQVSSYSLYLHECCQPVVTRIRAQRVACQAVQRQRTRKRQRSKEHTSLGHRIFLAISFILISGPSCGSLRVTLSPFLSLFSLAQLTRK